MKSPQRTAADLMWRQYQNINDNRYPTINEVMDFIVTTKEEYPYNIDISDMIEVFFTVLNPEDFQKFLSQIQFNDDLITAIPKLKNSSLTVLAYIADTQKTA